jgi:RecA-family ATPase
MQALAMVAGGSVTILSHPSLSGINSGSGISGSTAWHGAFRFRQYLTSTKPEAGEQPDNDLRQLEFKKNQYGPIGETIVLRYQNGLFLPLPGAASLDKLANSTKLSWPRRGQRTTWRVPQRRRGWRRPRNIPKINLTIGRRTRLIVQHSRVLRRGPVR